MSDTARQITDEPYGLLLSIRSYAESCARNALNPRQEFHKAVVEALNRIDDALDLCTWDSSTKEEIEAALLGQLGPDHPMTKARAEGEPMSS